MMANFVSFLLCAALCAVAQESGDYSKEELLSKLKTQEAKLDLDQAATEMERAKADYEEAKQLFDSKVYTIDELNRKKTAYEQASLRHQQTKIALEKTRLNLLQNATLITLVDAKKYRAADGEIMVSVRLRNDSDKDQARIAMAQAGVAPGNDLASLLAINNIIVSLRGTGQSSTAGEAGSTAIVGDPFQQIIAKLRLGSEQTLAYKLLKKELEEITIELSYLDKKQSFTVFLKKEATQDLPTVNSTQYAQQGQLGTKIKYDLVLERLAKTEQSFSLIVLNLPREFPFAFIDPQSQARITHLKFSEQISKQSLDFELSVPEKLDKSFIDQSIEFVIIVCRQNDIKRIYDTKKQYGDKAIPAETLNTLPGNQAQLILIPKGSGRLEIIIPNLYKEIKKGEDFKLKISLLNAGTMEIRKVTPAADFPLEWEGTLTPKVIDLIEPDQKALCVIDVNPPGDVAVGEYTMKITVSGSSGTETIEAVDKLFTIRVSAESNILGTIILVIVLIGMVAGIAVASIKISRR